VFQNKTCTLPSHYSWPYNSPRQAPVFTDHLSSTKASLVQSSPRTPGNPRLISNPGSFASEPILIINLVFGVSNPRATIAYHYVSFNCVLISHNADRELRGSTATLSRPVMCDPRGETSRKILFLFDRFIRDDHVDSRSDVTEFGEITDAVISWSYGEFAHLTFQMWIRALFGVVSFLNKFLFWFRLRPIKTETWMLEQELTMALSL
jgi:hypothetical protein